MISPQNETERMHIIRTVGKLPMSEDMRVYKTKRNIERTFLELLAKHPFDKITVQMITKEALVNKGTFYRHYTDKYDLAHQVAQNTLDRLAIHVRANTEGAAGDAGRSDTNRYMRTLLATFDDVLPDLVLLNNINLPDVNIRVSMTRVICDGLRSHIKDGRELESLETEAWVIAQLTLAYPEYMEDTEKPLDLFGYIVSVHQASELFLPWLSDGSDMRAAHEAYYDATCMLPSARPSWLANATHAGQPAHPAALGDALRADAPWGEKDRGASARGEKDRGPHGEGDR